VELVISDAHGGIKAAIAQVCPTPPGNGVEPTSWPTWPLGPQGSWPMIATLVRSIFEQPDRDATWSQLGDVVDKLTQAGFCDAALYLLDAADDILAFSAFPVEHWPKIRSNNPQERLNKEIRRRTDVVGIFPNRARRHPPRRRPAGRADRRVGHGQALHERRGRLAAAPDGGPGVGALPEGSKYLVAQPAARESARMSVSDDRAAVLDPEGP
jgi:hypothetical protein